MRKSDRARDTPARGSRTAAGGFPGRRHDERVIRKVSGDDHDGALARQLQILVHRARPDGGADPAGANDSRGRRAHLRGAIEQTAQAHGRLRLVVRQHLGRNAQEIQLRHGDAALKPMLHLVGLSGLSTPADEQQDRDAGDLRRRQRGEEGSTAFPSPEFWRYTTAVRPVAR